MIYDVMEVVLGLVLVVITTYLIPYLKTKTTAEKRSELEFWVITAVRAAEQIYHGIKESGVLKKEYVVSFLLEKGIDTEDIGIDHLIEKAVLELKRSDSL